MKLKIFILILTLIICTAFNPLKAQTEIEINPNDNRTYSKIFDSLSTGLIPNRIPFGTLYDRVYQWSALTEWQINDTTSLKHLYQSWYDAEQAVTDSTLRPARYEAMRNTVQRQIYAVRLPLIALNFRFGYIDSLATTDGRLTVNNGLLTDNNNASPYLTKQVAIAGLGLDKVILNKTYLLQFDTAVILNNTTQNIQSITVYNITTGASYFVQNYAAAQSVSFTQAGVNILRFTLNLNNGSSLTNYQSINAEDMGYSSGGGILSRPDGPSCLPTNDLLESTIPFQGYSETVATNSFADYHIYYHTTSLTGTDNCERVLRKPVIILDGFDPQDGMKYNELYTSYLSYGPINDRIRLGDELRDKGYDVIILNFPKLGTIIKGEGGVADKTIPIKVKVNGTTLETDRVNRDGGSDYIERNAFLLVKLIQEVNRTLVANFSAEKLIVVGPSMGGQISRYALAYMEKQQSLGVAEMNHNTRLFISYDSPNDGANIPVALNHNLKFFGYFGGNQAAKESYDERLHSVAARQLLIEQMDGLNSTSPFHQTFYNNARSNGLPNSGGYPVNLRKVSLLNGNGGSIKTYNDGTEVLNLHGISKNFGIDFLVFIAEDNFMPATGQTIRIAKTRLTQKKPLIIFKGTSTVLNNNLRGSMDAVQGSTFDATQIVYKGFSEGLKTQKVHENLAKLLPNHCFIPSVSALGFRNSNFNWNDNLLNRNLLCNNEIYFDGYFIPTTNEEHITLTKENVNWLSQEIDKGQPNCPKICSFSINGAYNLCTNSDKTYSLDVTVPAGCSTTWEQSSVYQIISYTNNSVTVRGISNGVAFIKAHITNPCGADINISKEINVGPIPVTDISISVPYGDPNNLECFTMYTAYGYYGGSEGQPTAFEWGINPEWPIVGGNTNHSVNFFANVSNNVNGYLTLKLQNVCGWSNEQVLFMHGSCDNGNYRMSVSPNPAKGEIFVTIKNITSKNIENEKIDFVLYDFLTRNVVKRWTALSGQSQFKLNIIGIKAGQYVLESNKGKLRQTQLIIIN